MTSFSSGVGENRLVFLFQTLNTGIVNADWLLARPRCVSKTQKRCGAAMVLQHCVVVKMSTGMGVRKIV